MHVGIKRIGKTKTMHMYMIPITLFIFSLIKQNTCMHKNPIKIDPWYTHNDNTIS